MPIPIKRHDSFDSSSSSIDFSSLITNIGNPNDIGSADLMGRMQLTASNRDADLLLDLWKNSNCENEKLSPKPEYQVDNSDIIRLKTNGLITGDVASINLTKRGKKVITVMLLGEPNNFEQKKQKKNYHEILASMNKKGKTGYRIPK